MRYLIIISISFLLINCGPSLFNGLNNGNNSVGQSDCARIRNSCKGQYSEHVDKNGKVYCSCTGEQGMN